MTSSVQWNPACYPHQTSSPTLLFPSGGDPEGVFTINRTETSVGQLMVASRLDREQRDNYLLTVRCVSEPPQGRQRSPYDPQVSSMGPREAIGALAGQWG